MNNRYDILYLFDAKDANPNGDPDAGNLPRLDAETGQGLTTDVMLKRKIRNFIEQTTEHNIYFKEFAVHNQQHEEAYKALDLGDPKKAKRAEFDKAREWMCQNFYDVRTFGAVMSTKVNCGQVRGPVQLSFARSIDPIITSEHAITRTSVTDVKDIEKARTMGRKFTVPYGLYKASGFINPFLAQQTGFSEDDLELLFTALENAFQFDQSAARPAGSMNVRKLVIFKHENALGKAPSAKLLEGVSVKKKDGIEVARSFDDYKVTIPTELRSFCADNGIEIIERV
ncbi:type I-C CRISPR-associated protein Cas7/Csd2 [Persicirhabdus sediminis]|uniref:Type I-C CRISPR-associated protein Cas7/Csd2 n=1 Tax=Persicirhabdus sediminis TaxID=454144 RepID=A0A8J7SPP8_9BACT|nr:type I-C CRISPR-associated protein Cas7/Csd2 [Persicirhabdus sediminis]MBK1792483.1 type I-C CRISPR-associated protein Cas7/Csd2 [Persicirhabdus sediminis]